MAVFMIGNRRYEHKYLAEGTVKAVLNDPRYIDTGLRLNGEDHALIQDLFDSCPYYGRIKDRGVVGFEVRTNHNPEYSQLTHCFWAIHPDGSASEWSQDTALGRKETGSAKVRKAGRNATGDVIKGFRAEAFGNRTTIPCMGATCSKQVSRDESEIHHDGDFQFEDIVLHWEDLGGDTKTKSAYFMNPRTKVEFVDFHNALAQLVVLCRDCHKMETAEAARRRAADPQPEERVMNQPFDMFS